MRIRHLRYGRALRAIAVAGLASVAACEAQVLSPGAPYDERQPRVERVSTYVFVDMQPRFMPAAFRRAFEARLAKEFARSGVASQQLWFADTQAGRDLIADPKAYTAVHLTTIPIGKTARENMAKDRAFRPSHWLLIYPTESEPSGEGAVMTVRWEFKNSKTGYIDWSVFSVAHALWATMDPAVAEQAANDFVDGMVAEMRRCKVIGEPADAK